MNTYRLIDHTKLVRSQFRAADDAAAQVVAFDYYKSTGIHMKPTRMWDSYKVLVAMQHKLTDAQLSSIVDCSKMDKPVDVVYLKDVDADLFASLASMKWGDDLNALAKRLHNAINDGGYLAVIMPIGSPAFMATFCMMKTDNMPRLLFSHSDRVSVDNGDGTKTSTFVHVKWIAAGDDTFSHQLAWMFNGNALTF